MANRTKQQQEKPTEKKKEREKFKGRKGEKRSGRKPACKDTFCKARPAKHQRHPAAILNVLTKHSEMGDNEKATPETASLQSDLSRILYINIFNK